MSTLFPDQLEALAKVQQAFDAGFCAVLLVAATGFGKTHCAVEVIRRWNAEGRTVWFLAHLRELLDDTAARLAARQMPSGWIRSRYPGEPAAPCQLVDMTQPEATGSTSPPLQLTRSSSRGGSNDHILSGDSRPASIRSIVSAVVIR